MSNLRPYNDMLKVSYFTDEEAKSIHCGKFKLFEVTHEDQLFWDNIRANYITPDKFITFIKSEALTARDILSLAQTCKSLYNLIQPQQSFLKIKDYFDGERLLQIIKANPSLQFPLIFLSIKPTGTENFNAPRLDSYSAKMLEETNPYLKKMLSVCVDPHRSLWDEDIFSSFSQLYRSVSEVYFERPDLITQENCDLVMKFVPQLTSVHVYYGVDIRNRGEYHGALEALLATELSEAARHLPFAFQFSGEEITFAEAMSLFEKFPNLQAIDSAMHLGKQALFTQYEENLAQYHFIQDITVIHAVPKMSWLSLIEKSNLKTLRFQETLDDNNLQTLRPMFERLDPSLPLTISNHIRTKVRFQIRTESGKKCQIHYTMLCELDRKFAEMRKKFMALKEAQTEEEQVPQQAQDDQTLESSGLFSQLFNVMRNIKLPAPKRVKQTPMTNPVPDLITSHTALSLKIEGKSDDKLHPISPLDEALLSIARQFSALQFLRVKGFIGSTPADRDSVPFFNNLMHLKLQRIQGFRTATLDYCLNAMPRLQSLIIKNSKTHILAKIKSPLPNLKHVNLCLFEMTSRSLSLFLKHVQNLETLILGADKRTELTDLDFKRHGATLDHLGHLELRSLKLIKTEHVLKVISEIPSLRKLVVSHCEMIKPEDFQAIFEKALTINPQLRMMNT